MRGWIAAAALVGACGDRSDRAGGAAVPDMARVEDDRCYRAGDAILSRLSPPSIGGASWVSLRSPAGDSGSGRLIEPTGAVLELAWTRTAGESLDVRGADDFIQFNARLATGESGLAGPARLFSDAQLERGADGRAIPAERRWMLSAVAAPCDSAPTPWSGAP